MDLGEHRIFTDSHLSQVHTDFRVDKNDASTRYLGSSAGGLSTNIHDWIDSLDHPLACAWSQGQKHACVQVIELIVYVAQESCLLADGSYNNENIHRELKNKKTPESCTQKNIDGIGFH